MFIPDQRNLGGRQIICNLLWNHRLSLNIMDEKSINSPFQTKMNTPRQGCQTERQQLKPSLFFRRLPTSNNKKQYTELLYQKPLSYPKKKIQPPKQIREIDWDSIEEELKKYGPAFLKMNQSAIITKLAKRHQISKEYDFASLIEMILNIYPNAKQIILIEIASQIIVDSH